MEEVNHWDYLLRLIKRKKTLREKLLYVQQNATEASKNCDVYGGVLTNQDLKCFIM